MTKENKILPQAIKIVVCEYGKDVVCDVRLVNIINDMMTLEDNVAVSNILREVLTHGYGLKLLSLNPVNEDCDLKIINFSNSFSALRGFNECIVQYVLYSIAYGIGIIQKEPRLFDTENKQIEKPVQFTSNYTKEDHKKNSIIEKDDSNVEDEKETLIEKIAISIGTIIGIIIAFVIMAMPVLGFIFLIDGKNAIWGAFLFPIGLFAFIYVITYLLRKHGTT